MGGSLLLLAAVTLLVSLPVWAPAVLDDRGIAVDALSWCDLGERGPGLCARGVRRGAVSVDAASMDRHRRVELGTVRVALSSGAGGVPDGAGATSSGGGWVSRVDVERLVVEGLPLPELSGQLWPVRELDGEGVEIRDRRATLTRATPWGPGTAEVERTEEGFRVAAVIAPFSLTHDRLGGTLALDRVTFDGRWRPEVGVDGTLSDGTVRVEVAGEASGEGLALEWSLQPTELLAIYNVFSKLVPEARRATIRGQLSASGTLKLSLGDGEPELTVKPQLDRPWVDGLLPLGFGAAGVSWAAPQPDGSFEARSALATSPDWLEPGAAGELLPAAILAAEDGGFYHHRGYDLEGMLLAASENAEAGSVRRGGSTLTQQLAKNLFTGNERTYTRKLRELLYTLELERELGKTGILRLYLNIVEWGPGIFGARAAARTYFLKAPSGLLPEEAAWMASVLRSPRAAYEKQYLRGKADPARVAQVLGNMVALDDGARQAALQRGVRFVPP